MCILTFCFVQSANMEEARVYDVKCSRPPGGNPLSSILVYNLWVNTEGDKEDIVQFLFNGNLKW